MKILILAAGYAIRLHPLTINTPKPLLEVGGRRMIERIIEKAEPLKDEAPIYIITNAKFFENFKSWQEESEYKDIVSIINDGTSTNETRLGAIKDMEFAISKAHICDDLLVIAGDNLFEFDLSLFVKFAKTNPDGISVALHDVKNLDAAKLFGVLKINNRNKVIDFEEKPAAPKSTLISTGIYYFPKEKLQSIKEFISSVGKGSDAPGYYIKWMSSRGSVYGRIFLEDWYDIGDMESYRKANLDYSQR